MPELSLFQLLVANAPPKPLWQFTPSGFGPEPNAEDAEARARFSEQWRLAVLTQWPWVYAHAVMRHETMNESELEKVCRTSKPTPRQWKTLYG